MSLREKPKKTCMFKKNVYARAASCGGRRRTRRGTAENKQIIIVCVTGVKHHTTPPPPKFNKQVALWCLTTTGDHSACCYRSTIAPLLSDVVVWRLVPARAITGRAGGWWLAGCYYAPATPRATPAARAPGGGRPLPAASCGRLRGPPLRSHHQRAHQTALVVRRYY